jgi:hypothetical protein
MPMPHGFWGIAVHPDTPVLADVEEDSNLRVTNACIAEPVTAPARLFAVIDTFVPDQETLQTDRTLVATFLPGQREQRQLSLIMTGLNRITFQVEGEVPICVSGLLEETGSDSDLLEEEEEEEEAREDQ